MRLIILATFFTMNVTVSVPATAVANEQLAANAQRILNSRCGECHGKTNPQSGFCIVEHAQLLGKTLQDGESYAIVPGNLEASELWQRISATDEDLVMPPTDRLPAEELTIIRQWIESGAKRAEPHAQKPTTKRAFVTTLDAYQAMEEDLNRHPDQADDFRYFSIRHLHNNPTVADDTLRTYRAALSKLVNSLHWQSTIIVPEPIDANKTILRVNLVDLGWDRARLWTEILKLYPYGLSHDRSLSLPLAASAERVYDVTGCRIPLVRADWFVATASVPPLYHTLLDLPDGPNADRALEYRLKVDVQRDFIKDRLIRAGFVASNVSEHNRLVDRHPAAYGAYWKSYDFASSVGRQDLTRAPLGPRFRDNEFSLHAFNHDGGEIIFNLPNGMQGYMLVDGQGDRIDEGPINVVFDSKQPLGNKHVINGISCIVCHSRGMQPFRDSIRDASSLNGAAGQKVRRLFRTNEALQKTLEQDSKRFLEALDDATTPFLNAGDDPMKREPVVAIAKSFTQSLDLTVVTGELGLANSRRITPLLEQLELQILSDGGAMKRDTWQGTSPRQPYSRFQIVSEKLRLGTPERIF